MKTHKDLAVWNKSIELVVEIYQITETFPKSEIYGLTSQMRRAAVSIPSNVAEGAARKSNKEFIQFLHISLGSLSEIETQIIISSKLDLIDNKIHQKLTNEIIEIRKMLFGLIRTVKT